MCKKTLSLAGMLILTFISSGISKGKFQSVGQAEQSIQKSLNKFCLDCHYEKKQKGDLRLDDFIKLNDELKFEVLNKIEEQVFLEKMPPEDEDILPTAAEREAWLDTIKSWNELRNSKSAFREKLKSPAYGNYVDHEKLFSGDYKHLKAFTYDRNWLLSEYIFREKLNRITGNSVIRLNFGSEQKLFKGKALHNVLSNPFLLPKESGVRYYANEELSESHFLTMLGNVGFVSNQIISKSESNSGYLPALTKITAVKARHDDILLSRKEFLKENIDRVCEDLYKEKNETLLPVYEENKLEGPILKKDKSITLRVISLSEKDILLTVKRFVRKDISNIDLIRKCEQYWYHFGVSEVNIKRKVNVLRKAVILIRNHKTVRNYTHPPYKPLNSSEMKEITETIRRVRTKGVPYNEIIAKCMSYWRTKFDQLRNEKGISEELAVELIEQLYQKIFERSPTGNEISANAELLKSYLTYTSINEAVKKLIETLLLKSEFLVRKEFGSGKADQYGRRMLSPRDASYAIAYALTDSSPDEELVKAANEGRLNTREDYKREVLRLLKDRSQYYLIRKLPDNAEMSSFTNTPIRKLRFFRDFFGYPNMLEVFKDQKRFGARGMDPSRLRLLIEADRLVDHIIQKDEDVFNQLLTTDKYYILHNGDNESMLEGAEQFKKSYEYFKDKNWQKFTLKDLEKHSELIKGIVDGRSKGNQRLEGFKNSMSEISSKFAGKNEYIFPDVGAMGVRVQVYKGRKQQSIGGTGVTLFYDISLNNWNYNPVQPMKIENRMGMLTHPAWLQAFSQNNHSDPVIRGKWVREKLLAGTVPDVPITVDAVIPEDHTKTLRERLDSVTSVKECWRCHKYMNPLGYAFENYDDFGRFRTKEEIEHEKNVLNAERDKKIRPSRRHFHRLRYKTKPVNAAGVLKGTGNSELDGEVKDAQDMIRRLVKSNRVRQSIIRHAFRYFMGRNEMLSDSKTLIDADEAYVNSGGSFDAVIVSLLTSDSFIYRKEVKE